MVLLPRGERSKQRSQAPGKWRGEVSEAPGRHQTQEAWVKIQWDPGRVTCFLSIISNCKMGEIITLAHTALWKAGAHSRRLTDTGAPSPILFSAIRPS